MILHSHTNKQNKSTLTLIFFFILKRKINEAGSSYKARFPVHSLTHLVTLLRGTSSLQLERFILFLYQHHSSIAATSIQWRLPSTYSLSYLPTHYSILLIPIYTLQACRHSYFKYMFVLWRREWLVYRERYLCKSHAAISDKRFLPPVFFLPQRFQ